MARAVGAPVAHAAHCGPVKCPMALPPGLTYDGHYQGGACIVDGRGGVLAWRGASDGPGMVIADVQPGRVSPTLEVDAGFWLHPRGILPAAIWGYQNAHGRRWYRRHAVGRQPERRSLKELAASASAAEAASRRSPAAVDEPA